MPNLDLGQLRKQAKEIVRERRSEGRPIKLSEAQFELAREHGFASWPNLKDYLSRLDAEQPFHTDIDYYEGRAAGIATVNGVSVAEARLDLARRHGFPSWNRLRRHVAALAGGTEPPPPFMLAYRAVEDDDVETLAAMLDAHPELIEARGTNGNDLLGMARSVEAARLLLDRGADPNRGNDYGWTKLHQAGYSNWVTMAELMTAAGGRLGVSARGDGDTPLVAALFWGHREVVPLLGLEPGNLRVAAGLGLPEMIRELHGTPAAGAHRAFYRPHGGFPSWQPSEDPQEVIDEALVWAAKADRVEVLGLLVELGARVDADPYRGTALIWAAANGHAASVRKLVELGADPNWRATFGGPTHGQGVTALHLAAQAGRAEAVEALLGLGADPAIRDDLHDSPPAGWAAFGGHAELAERLTEATGGPRGRR
jgi:ankyrin repeat protein